MTSQPIPDDATNGAAGDTGPSPAIAEEAVLNAAMAFAGHVATAAQQQAAAAAEAASPTLREVMVRQFLLETATLCLRRLGESYEASASDADLSAVVTQLQEGARQAKAATATVEALGDLSLDVLDQLLER